MARGFQDWFDVQTIAGNDNISDIGELAVRLGSIYSYKRSGNVYYMNGFETDTKDYIINQTLPNLSISRNTLLSATGGLSVRFNAAAVAGLSGNLAKYVPNRQSSMLGITFNLCIGTSTTVFDLLVNSFKRTYYILAGLRYDTVSKTFSIKNSLGVYEPVLTYDLELGNNTALFHDIKLVIDTENKVYDRLEVNDVIVDLSNYDIENYTANTNNLTVFAPSITSDTSGIRTFWIDNLILTENEPSIAEI